MNFRYGKFFLKNLPQSLFCFFSRFSRSISSRNLHFPSLFLDFFLFISNFSSFLYNFLYRFTFFLLFFLFCLSRKIYLFSIYFFYWGALCAIVPIFALSSAFPLYCLCLIPKASNNKPEVAITIGSCPVIDR